MPIEFACPQCGRTLRTPDGSEGKRAKCPSCEMVATIPDASSAGSGGSAPADREFNPFAESSAGSGAESGNPFATSAAGGGGNPFAESGSRPASGGGTGFGDPANPYASPATAAEQSYAVTGGMLRHSRIDFGEVLSGSWNVFSANMGGLVLLAAVIIALAIGAYVLLIGGAIAGAAPGIAAEDETMAIIGGVVAGGIVGIGLLFGIAWITAGATHYVLLVARGRQPSLSEVFSGGPFLMRMAGFLFITQVLIGQALPYVGAAPGYFLEEPLVMSIGQVIASIIGAIANAFFFALAPYFIVDRNAGVFESFSLSMTYLSGNRLTLFALYLVVGILGGIFMLITCGIGALFYVPFYMLLMTVVYLMATSQRIATSPR